MRNRETNRHNRGIVQGVGAMCLALAGLVLLSRLRERQTSTDDHANEPVHNSVESSEQPQPETGGGWTLPKALLLILAAVLPLGVAVGLRMLLWPHLSPRQVLGIAGIMICCTLVWWLTGSHRQSLASLLMVIATVAIALPLAFRLQELLWPEVSMTRTLVATAVVLLWLVWWLSDVSHHGTTAGLFAAVAIVAILLDLVVDFRDRLEFQIPNLLLVAVVGIFLAGLFLWWHDRGQDGSKSELGAALLGGTVVAFAVLGFQWVLEQDREAAANEQSFRIAIGLQQDLSGVDLSNRDLSGFYLAGKTLNGADLSGANLSGANLAGASLGGAHLADADLSEANLRNASLRQADLTNANLTEVNLSEANLVHADLTNANLTYSKLIRADLTASYLIGADFTNARTSGADLTAALADSTTSWPERFNKKKFRIYVLGPRTDLREADLSDADLTGEDLTGADLSGANLSDADLEGADLSGANLSHARFGAASLIECKLLGADMTGAKLSGADLTEALADSATQWPTGFIPQEAGAYVLEPGADLREADLFLKDLSGLDLTGADLSGTNLVGARLFETILTGAKLWDADLSLAVANPKTRWPKGFDPAKNGAFVLKPGVDLRGVDLSLEDLSEADLTRANLSGADLHDADLSRVKLVGADLTNVDLTGADFTESDLTGAKLTGARADSSTKWPKGFDTGVAGVLME